MSSLILILSYRIVSSFFDLTMAAHSSHTKNSECKVSGPEHKKECYCKCCGKNYMHEEWCELKPSGERKTTLTELHTVDSEIFDDRDQTNKLNGIIIGYYCGDRPSIEYNNANNSSAFGFYKS